MKFLLKLLFLTVIVSATANAQTPVTAVPDFIFYKLDKTPFASKNLQPNKLSLIVFFDANCDHCQHAMTTYNKSYKELNKTAVYLITLDNKQTIDKFMTKYGSNLYHAKNVTILQDLKNEFISRFRPRKYPSMFLFGADKKLLIYDDEPNNIGNFLKKIKATAK